MYNLELNQPGSSRQAYNYSFYSDHFTRNTAADRVRESNRGTRHNTQNIQHNPNMMNYSHLQWHPQNMIPPTNIQNHQKDRKYNKRHPHQNWKNKTYNLNSNSDQKNDTLIKSGDFDYKIYKCPNCSLQFDFINRNNFFVGKVPLILNCKHTVCQDCIQKIAKDNAVLCPICKNPSVLPPRYSPENLQDFFSPNFFLIGYIMWCKTQRANPHFMSLVPVQNRRSISPISCPTPEKQHTGETCCFLSCNKKATLKCQDCSDVYCPDCCTAVHKSAKSLWSHKQISLKDDNKKPNSQLEFCSEHELDVDFYCTICNIEVCCYCFIEKHEGHTKENLAKLDEVEIEEFKLNREKAKKTLKQLLITQKRLRDMRTCNTANIQKRISNYFVNLHSKLQCIEKQLKKEISNYEKEGCSLTNVNDLNGTVQNYVNELKTICSACDAAEVKKMNLKQIALDLKKVQDIPCYLISEDAKELEQLTFEVQPVIDNLEEMFTLKKNDNGTFRLVSGEDLPSDYEMDANDLYYDTDVESSLNKTVLSDESKPTKQAFKTGRQVTLENEMVEVTHIESLECFYVQLKKIQYQFAQMNSDINNYIKFGAPMVEHPQLNELYLVLYQSRNEKIWCRGRITEIKNGEMEPMYEVFFIDYGSSQTVDVSKIRQITPDISRKKAFAIQCTLSNPSVSSWNKNAHVYMARIINGKQVSMLVKKVHSGVHVVDLMVTSSDRGQTSIIDILSHMCSNVSDTDTTASQKTSFNRGYKIFANSTEFRKFQQEKIIIVNVIDPHHIFVHIASHSESLKKMNNCLRQTYRNSKKNNCIPIEGTYVIVEYKDNIRGNWHRGLVNKIDVTTEKCHVLLIDWGLNVTVDWSNIRMMQEDFTRLESQAILVKLAHVEPIDTTWVDTATIFIQKYFRSQEIMKMIVHEIDPLEIALFEIVGDVDICINTQLVLEHFAVSTGKISQTLEWPRNDAKTKPFLEDDSLLDALLKRFDKSINDSDNEDDTNVVKQKIEVVEFVDPSLIYIKFCKNEQIEMNLNKELQIHYSKERTTKDSWDVGEFCIVLYNFSYVRGKILEKIDNNKYRVNVYDKAANVEVSLNKIFEFDKYFSKFPNVAYKAHLANIRPAGGDKWSLSSIEALERLFEKYEIFGTRVEGDTTGKSIPMQMWYAHVKMGGALEASKTKFISLNQLLIKLGFAYKLHSTRSSPNNTEISIRSTKSSDSPLLCAIKKTAGLDSSSDACSDQDSIVEETKSEDAPDSKSIEQHKEEEPIKSFKSLTDWNELMEEEEKLKKCENDVEEEEIEDWIEPFSIKETEFYAWITCAETGGILYLREEKLQNVYKEMEQNIKEYFDKEPPSPPDDDWQPGHLCTINYNDLYYRGKVYKVNNPDDITVVMIDFGSDHKLSSKNLIRKILYPQIPAFASKIKLHKIYPKSGAWLDSDYQTLLDIVSEYSKIIIKSSLEDEIPSAEVFTDKGVNVNQYLVHTCPNLRRSEPKLVDGSDSDSVLEEEVIIEDEQIVVDEESGLIEIGSIIDTTKYTYKVLPLSNGDSNEKIAVSIMSVLDYNKIALKETATITDEFFELGEKMQKTIEYQPVIENLENGMPCACQFSEDMIWYRAQIYNMDGLDCGYVFVFFVDFGNVESVPVTDIKMMRPEWFDLPVSCHIANVNIELVSDKNIQHVTQFMKKLYGKNKLANIVSKAPLSIDLFDLDGEIYYKSLLEKGLIKMK
ncbi:uncharacterized protein LOC130445637 [Diorhabda sublineata]|uniref:uncharacterized protein LOC130445637 n=1 Tax=Diorhabda sublineata TaxID=1163346 RepID=UPI0024E0E6B3|nr:uncharacterized protein LOC130445637 [Diorhabda sublineata]